MACRGTLRLVVQCVAEQWIYTVQLAGDLAFAFKMAHMPPVTPCQGICATLIDQAGTEYLVCGRTLSWRCSPTIHPRIPQFAIRLGYDLNQLANLYLFKIF